MQTIFFMAALIYTAYGCTKSGWSDWINDYQASTKLFPDETREPGLSLYGGDIENMNRTARNEFCPSRNGVITDIQCVTAWNETSYGKAQVVKYHMSCDITNGFKCTNRLTKSGKCLDYKIRLFCNCSNSAQLTTRSNTHANSVNSQESCPSSSHIYFSSIPPSAFGNTLASRNNAEGHMIRNNVIIFISLCFFVTDSMVILGKN